MSNANEDRSFRHGENEDQRLTARWPTFMTLVYPALATSLKPFFAMAKNGLREVAKAG